jgi:hypothetical protein
MGLPLLNMIFFILIQICLYCTFISAAVACVHQEDLRKQWSVLGTFLCPRAVNREQLDAVLTRSLARNNF